MESEREHISPCSLPSSAEVFQEVSQQSRSPGGLLLLRERKQGGWCGGGLHWLPELASLRSNWECIAEQCAVLVEHVLHIQRGHPWTERSTCTGDGGNRNGTCLPHSERAASRHAEEEALITCSGKKGGPILKHRLAGYSPGPVRRANFGVGCSMLATKAESEVI